MSVPSKAEQAAGWPRLVGELKGLRVRLRREASTHMVTLPAGYEGTLQPSTGWKRIQFLGDACKCCGVKPRIHGLRRTDLEVIR